MSTAAAVWLLAAPLRIQRMYLRLLRFVGQNCRPFLVGQAHANTPELPGTPRDVLWDGTISNALRLRRQLQERLKATVPTLQQQLISRVR